MLQAGTQTAAVVLRDCADHLAHGVVVFAGPGNNGGDAYVTAAQLARAGVRVRLVVAAPPRTTDAQRAAAIAERYRGDLLSMGDAVGDEQVAIDGLLGTGHRGELREPMAEPVERLAGYRARQALVVALDVPSGMDATSGVCATGSVRAHITVTYGTIKRGLLLARARVGRVVLLDIGLGAHVALPDGAWCAASMSSLAEIVPAIAWNAHKGSRGQLALIGGSVGMVGAIVLATRAALRSGIGLARAWVESPGVAVLQQAVPQAIAHTWDTTSTNLVPLGDALAIGPGLGRATGALHVLRTALDRNPGVPVVLDADALTLIAESGADPAELVRSWCGDRVVVCTPHQGEFARLIGRTVSTDWEQRANDLKEFAVRARATVLLKGAPTLLASPDHGPVAVMPRGLALLATGGSGDLLTGIVGTLLAQGLPASSAAMLGATVHGLAAERAASLANGIRGLTLDDVLSVLPDVWREISHPAILPPGVLAELPAPE